MTSIRQLQSIEAAKANKPLGSAARALTGEPLVITEGGEPIAVLLPVRDTDLESLSVGTDPDFAELIQRSRARQKKERNLSSSEARRQLAIKPTNGKRRR